MTSPRRSMLILIKMAMLAPIQGASATEPSPTLDVPLMIEEAAAAGIDHRYSGAWEFFVGGGVAALDCNGDRFPDLAFAGGAGQAKVYANRSTKGSKLAFQEVADALPPGVDKMITGFYPLDVDNDGIKELIALRVGENQILKGGPDCSFTPANRAFAFDGGRSWTTAFSATFEEGQRFPTMAFGNYVDRTAPGTPWGTCDDNRLMRPRAGDRLDYQDPLPLTPGFCALSILFTDWDRSGTASLRITNDRQYYRGGQEQLWRIDPGRPPRAYRSADGWERLTIWGMGIAEADLDADGLPEYALTSMGDTKLQKLDEEAEIGRPSYRDIAFERGATAHRPYAGSDLKPSTGWHADFADLNNDGRLDLYIAKGNVERMPDFAAFDPDNLLLGRADGSFTEVGEKAGLAMARRGRGAVITDFNLDGMLDLAVVNREEPASLFRNAGARFGEMTRPMGNWLGIALRQDGSNRDAIGAVLSIKSGNETRSRTLQVGGGHASGHLGFIHVGLGVAERAEIRIRWPSGDWSAGYRLFANNFVVIDKGAPEARYWYPPSTVLPVDDTK